MPLVDTNVLFDLVTNDPIWADWSFRQLETHGLGDRLVVNPVVYAELSVGFDQIEKVDAFLGETGVEMIEIPRAALFLAGQGVSKLSGPGRHQDRRAARLLHRRPCRGWRDGPSDPRCPTLPDLLPEHPSDHAR